MGAYPNHRIIKGSDLDLRLSEYLRYGLEAYQALCKKQRQAKKEAQNDKR